MQGKLNYDDINEDEINMIERVDINVIFLYAVSALCKCTWQPLKHTWNIPNKSLSHNRVHVHRNVFELL